MLVPVFATGEEDDHHFYAMEFIDGQSLSEVLTELRGEGASTYYLEPRGSYRDPSFHQLDAEVRKSWSFGSRGTMQLNVSIRNVLGSQNVPGISTNDTLLSTDPESPGGCDPVTGENCMPNPDSTFGQVTAYQSPRSYELGLRFKW